MFVTIIFMTNGRYLKFYVLSHLTVSEWNSIQCKNATSVEIAHNDAFCGAHIRDDPSQIDGDVILVCCILYYALTPIKNVLLKFQKLTLQILSPHEICGKYTTCYRKHFTLVNENIDSVMHNLDFVVFAMYC